MEYVNLGKTNIRISKIGLGTWQWGSASWGYGKSYFFEDIKEAFKTAIDNGINFIDTAEIYGDGESGEIIGRLSEGYRENLVIATKVSPMHLTYRGVLRAFEGSTKRLQTNLMHH